MSSKADPKAVRWVKSSFSSGGDNCVEVAVTNATTGIRDSKIPHGPRIAVTTTAFTTFLSGVKADRPSRTA
ncbi:DUF397 domain-containing protein [Streptomyces sp. L-9-10]|uniref:DUF397 domain-containing protein n=1 Tax=Streptomyces sp. L-9-10 TaxID=1478131 RepID=UPI00101CA771|nr:DUF397 domain-containing protein [Streptomyces sp. L-9-10]